MEEQTVNIMFFLEMKLKTHITVIACDFIKTRVNRNVRRGSDEYNMYFVNLHVYRYRDYVAALPPLRPNKTKYISCRLCRELFEKIELSKIIPLKMIYEYI